MYFVWLTYYTKTYVYEFYLIHMFDIEATREAMYVWT